MSVRSLETKASYYPLTKRHITEERQNKLRRFKFLKLKKGRFEAVTHPMALTLPDYDHMSHRM